MPESEMTGDLFLFTRAAAETAATDAVEAERARMVERIAAGDEAAFNEFYRLYAPTVHGIVLARVRGDEVADIVQDVFLLAYKNLPALRDKSALPAWLAAIARNRANEFYRQTKETVELPEDLKSKRDARAEAQEILTAIRSLPDAYRETLVLRLVEGMTGNEIAERTGITPESVRVNLHRGMKMLRQRLGITE
jgi:RNA polymerase sigma-70 factor (ECF subfamily)